MPVSFYWVMSLRVWGAYLLILLISEGVHRKKFNFFFEGTTLIHPSSIFLTHWAASLPHPPKSITLTCFADGPSGKSWRRNEQVHS